MTVTPQHGVFLTADDAGYLADLLEHLCRTKHPAPRLAHLAGRFRKSCAALTPTQENGPNRLRDVPTGTDEGHYAAYDLVDSGQAAQMLGIGPAGVRDLIRRGKLPGHRAGNRWVLPARAVVERAERQADRRSG